VAVANHSRYRTIARKILPDPGRYPCAVPLTFEEMFVLGREHGHLTEKEITSRALSEERTEQAMADYASERSLECTLSADVQRVGSQMSQEPQEFAAPGEAGEGGSLQRCEAVSFRLCAEPSRERAVQYESTAAHVAPYPHKLCVSRKWDGGATTCAVHLYEESRGEARIGLMVAANSGRPAGAVGLRGSVKGVHTGHRTQEEDIVSNWLLTTAGRRQEDHDALYKGTIDCAWGMCEVNSTSRDTFQGVDYVSTTDPRSYSDAWLVHDALVCVKTMRSGPAKFLTDQKAPVSLVFSAGPNAGARGSRSGSMVRTLNRMASEEGCYAFFRECVKEAVRTGLDTMAIAGCTVALVARVSCGIYAGPHVRRISGDFTGLVDELLSEEVSPGRSRATYFEHVEIPLL